MGQDTKIEWADDSLNFWWGCTRYGEGCRFCYAEAMSKRFGDLWGPKSPRLYIEGAAETCLRLNRKAEREGKPRLVFVNSMSDFFEDHDGPVVSRKGNRFYIFENYLKEGSSPNAQICLPPATLNDLRKEAFGLFDECNWLRFLLLTKRPENIRRMTPKCSRCRGNGRVELLEHCPACKNGQRRNVWIGTSIATQEDAERNLHHLLKSGDLAPVLFASVEPLIEAVDLTAIEAHAEMQRSPNGGLKFNALSTSDDEHFYRPEAKISLVIVGGESGPNARECNIEAVRSIVKDCQAASVPVFVKQLGSNAVSGLKSDHLGRKSHGAPMGSGERSSEAWRLWLEDKKGGDPEEWPLDLRVREMPAVEAAR